MKGIKYHKVGDYYFPNIKVEHKNIELGYFGRKLLDYYKNHQHGLYLSTLANDTLLAYIKSMDIEMNKQYDLLIKQYIIERGITEELKSSNQLQWVQEMNNIKNCVEEIIYKEYIYKY